MGRSQAVSTGRRWCGLAVMLALALLAAACGPEQPADDVAAAPTATADDDGTDDAHDDGTDDAHDDDGEHDQSDVEVDLPSDALAFDATVLGGGAFQAQDLQGRDVAIWFYMPG